MGMELRSSLDYFSAPMLLPKPYASSNQIINIKKSTKFRLERLCTPYKTFYHFSNKIL